MKIKSLHLISLLAAFAAAVPATGLETYLAKKPNVKALESSVDFDVTAESRDLAWAAFKLSPGVAEDAVGYFNAHYVEKKGDLEKGARDTLNLYYAVTDDEWTLRDNTDEAEDDPLADPDPVIPSEDSVQVAGHLKHNFRVEGKRYKAGTQLSDIPEKVRSIIPDQYIASA